MFYSQFILAKKGPLGTIWIAAHLERKLRKNQVADTDIGVSVDSIICPDVPIALRLSSHLLLGVVRIYNRKVNYLFDDCSEALLKVKQAFRSTAVDLPPEESKAPYHSITLPEKFDLDDFELPDSDINLGNYVDHHISSREQITLQDTVEGVGYSTSKFGLDERFGDGGASGLDLEEELFLNKIGAAGDPDESADPQASYRPTSPFKPDDHLVDRATNSEIMAGGADEPADLMDYAHAPHTPRLVEEPNLSNTKDSFACDDHLEKEYHLMESTLRDNDDNVPYKGKQEVEWCSRDDTISDEVHLAKNDEIGHGSSGLGIHEFNPQHESPLDDQGEATRPISEFTDVIKATDVQPGEDFPVEAVKEVNKTGSNHQCPSEFDKEINASCDHQVSEGVTLKDLTSPGLDVSNCVVENPIVPKPEDNISADADVKSDDAALATQVTEETIEPGQGPEHASGEGYMVTVEEADTQVHNADSQDRLVGDLNNSKEPELPAPEKLLSVPEGHIDSHRDMLVEANMSEFEGLDVGDAGGKIAAGRKRSFTESTLTEQSLNSAESSRQVRVKRTAESVPDDDDLLSSILAGRKSSILKVKPTPVTEVTSMKRGRPGPRSSASKRKVLMDDTMVLHGDTIRLQLTNTEDIRRVRKKAPCTLSEISAIQKQDKEDEIFVETMFTGMTAELAFFHSQPCDLGHIRVCKDDVINGPSLETLTEARLPSQDGTNLATPQSTFGPNLATLDDKSGASLEPVAGLHLTSANNENHDKRPDEDNVIETSEQGVHNQISIAKDNETTGFSEVPSESEIMPEEVRDTRNCVNFSQEQTKLMGLDASLEKVLVDASDVRTTSTNSVSGNPFVIPEVEESDPNGHATNDTLQPSSLYDSGERNSHVNMDASDVALAELDCANIYGQGIARNEVAVKDGDISGDALTQVGEKDDIFPGLNENSVVEKGPEGNYGELDHNLETEIYNANTLGEHRDMEFSHQALEAMLETCENLNYPEAYQTNMMDGETSAFDMHYPDDINLACAGNDTEFLNVDDDELTEIADDTMPDDEEARCTENSGWSSRTRAVSKYLQMAFVKEGESGRMSLSMDNLLTGKSRKEASRMFFETLVLKTRDYIHVEQTNPYESITIKPRTRLMKSDF